MYLKLIFVVRSLIPPPSKRLSNGITSPMHKPGRQQVFVERKQKPANGKWDLHFHSSWLPLISQTMSLLFWRMWLYEFLILVWITEIGRACVHRESQWIPSQDFSFHFLFFFLWQSSFVIIESFGVPPTGEAWMLIFWYSSFQLYPFSFCNSFSV